MTVCHDKIIESSTILVSSRSGHAYQILPSKVKLKSWKPMKSFLSNTNLNLTLGAWDFTMTSKHWEQAGRQTSPNLVTRNSIIKNFSLKVFFLTTNQPNPQLHARKSSLYYQLRLESAIYESHLHAKLGAVCPKAHWNGLHTHKLKWGCWFMSVCCWAAKPAMLTLTSCQSVVYFCARKTNTCDMSFCSCTRSICFSPSLLRSIA